MPVTYWQHVARDARLYLILSNIGHEHDVQVLRVTLRTESRHKVVTSWNSVRRAVVKGCVVTNIDSDFG